jgi:ATP-dependent RNA helicase RhlE
VRAVVAEGYQAPTPIQSQAIPHVLAGHDLLGCAQTGTGKTAAFALPILHRIDALRRPAASRAPRVLVLSPTRELASQIAQSFARYGKHLHYRQTVVFGGVGQQPQVRAMSHGVHLLIATPGRLLDLMQQGHVRLDQLEIFVLDEADRMLDLGFLPDLRKIIAKLPAKRQSLFFSATLPSSILSLANSLLSNPVQVQVTPPTSTVDRIDQRVMYVDRGNKQTLLNQLLSTTDLQRVLVFTRTKHGADKVVHHLSRGGITTAAIHGNKSQSARERALLQFRRGSLRVLVATDLASRGIDVDGISHVINYDIPTEPETYVHRIGRTARAGATGIALSFCDAGEHGALRAIEKFIRQSIPVDANHSKPAVHPRPAGNRPAGNHRPAGNRPTGNRPAGKPFWRGDRSKARSSGSNNGSNTGSNHGPQQDAQHAARGPSNRPMGKRKRPNRKFAAAVN